ncbi:IS200/IS605 family transposase [Rhodohalobacter mucosus]|uniref:IS200/IS605 family transposase n=1 Tax=Rhodohalobacter mucosus TaxID=2079485 RepID=A0A316TU33_9BACT|nr:IS200/IS605 family transposase [Rhodohalobacter mucosus]PWN05812.1 IS200/IS605 family transposase [Rhodohalobacter mucosus]
MNKFLEFKAMGSFVITHVHTVFGTKSREALIQPRFENHLYKYISGIGKRKGIPIIKTGGMSDHIHILLLQPGKMPLCDIMQVIKGNTSKWINDNYYPDRRFRWQGGYGAFAVSMSQIEVVKRYIHNQKEHHKHYDFDSEYHNLLVKHKANIAVKHK